jgi:uncharacterized protein
MEKKITFTDSQGHNLVGVLSNPTTNLDTPVIVLCHGRTSSKDRATYTGLQKRLNQSGFASFRIDLFAHGESDGHVEDSTVSKGVDSILSAVKYLEQLGYSKIGLMGTSFGGICSLMAASKLPQLFVLALKRPLSNYIEKIKFKYGPNYLAEWKEKGFVEWRVGKNKTGKIPYSYVEDAEKNNGWDAAKHISMPTLIVHGTDDETVPLSHSEKTCDLIKGCRLEIIEGADHRFSKPEYFNKMMNTISTFLVEKAKQVM